MIYETLYEFDSQLRSDHGLFCGVDEAGRGPLAGPVCCAACILPEDVRIDGLNDSKKISEKKREALFDEIRAKALCFNIVFVDSETIDRINILAATMLGMKQAVEGLVSVPAFAAIDGNKVPDLSIPAESFVKGDARSASIAAASVLAKVSRDRLMREYAEKYPQYGFEKHKGYGTKQHYEAIEKYGVLPIHRRTFLKGII